MNRAILPPRAVSCYGGGMTEPEVRAALRAKRLAVLTDAADRYHFAMGTVGKAGRRRRLLAEEALRAAAFIYANTEQERLGPTCDKCPWINRDPIITRQLEAEAEAGSPCVCHTRMGQCWGAVLHCQGVPPVEGPMKLSDLAGAAEAVMAAHGDRVVLCYDSGGNLQPMQDLRIEKADADAVIVALADSEPAN